MEGLTKAEKRAKQQHAYYLRIREAKLAAAKERYQKLKADGVINVRPEPTHEQLIEARKKALEAKRRYYYKQKAKKAEAGETPEEAEKK